jgi:hypothetical protein
LLLQQQFALYLLGSIGLEDMKFNNQLQAGTLKKDCAVIPDVCTRMYVAPDFVLYLICIGNTVTQIPSTTDDLYKNC